MPKTPLDEYAARRSFEATPEPGAQLTAPASGPLLFVVQQHDARRLHYDLRLECDGVLKSWAVPKGPSLDTRQKRLATPTEDHPYDYASFEGVIPAGQYGAGEVIVWDCGVYSPDEDGLWFHDRQQAQRQVREGLAKGKLSFQLRGEKLKGSFALVRTKDPKVWLLIKHRDRFVSTRDVTQDNRSVLSGATVGELKRRPVPRLAARELVPSGQPVRLPAKLSPMLAQTAAAPFVDANWSWEPKLDGYRVLAFVVEDGVKLRSRRGLELARAFPELCAQLAQDGPPGTILDGEIIAFDAAGKPSFNALQNRVQLRTEREIAQADAKSPALFYAFDLPFFAGLDLRAAAYRHRRRYLAQCLLPSPQLQPVHASSDGPALYEAALASGFEGVVGKRRDSAYEDGRRSGAWLKVKPVQTADFVIGGFTRGKGAREPLGALLVGWWDEPARGKPVLRYASHVGSGFDDKSVVAVKRRLEPLARKTCPFADTPAVNGPVTWVEPRLVAEIGFQSWTEDGSLRAPIFRRLRDDVDARAVRGAASAPAPGPGDVVDAIVAQLDGAKNELMLAVGEHRIRLTHLDRVYWPEDRTLKQPPLTKRDLLRYLAQVSPLMLPHLRDRPLTMIRMPDGIGGQRFFQKHWEQARPEFVETLDIYSSSRDENSEYLLCNNLPTLLWLGQAGTLEFHVWHSRAADGPDAEFASHDYASSLQALEASALNYPDYVVFDIDPYIYSGQEKPGDEPELNTVAFEKGKQVAFRLRELLNGMGVEPIVKLSGKTGLHVFVPIERRLDFDAARAVSELVGRHLMRRCPGDITMEWSIPKRTGKIFMDYNMNVRGKTLNVAYSPRGVAGAPVSMPLSWEELAHAHPLDFRLYNVIERLRREGDRWGDVLERKVDLRKLLGL